MDILIKSVLGGITIGVVLLTARFLSPTVAGLLTAVPVIFTFSFFTGIYSQSSIVQQSYLFNTFISTILTAGFIGHLFLLFKAYPEKINLNLTLGFATYLLIMLTYNYAR
jgi:hypothetical protein